MVEAKDKYDLERWQRLLRLQDWTITLRVNVTSADMPSAGSFGDVEYVESTKTGTVYIVNPDTLPKAMREQFNFNRTYLHELLHLKMSLLDDCNPMQDRILHQIIDDIAKAITEIEDNKNE